MDNYASLPYINKLIWAESRNKYNAVSKRKAYGLMQVTQPALDDYYKVTGIKYTINDILNDHKKNIEVGIWYLLRLKEHFKEDVVAVSAYNVGYGNTYSNIINVDYAISILGEKRVLEYLKGKKVTMYKRAWRLWYVEEK